MTDIFAFLRKVIINLEMVYKTESHLQNIKKNVFSNYLIPISMIYYSYESHRP